MIKQTIQPKYRIHENLDIKYGNFDFLDLIKLKKRCQHREYRSGCSDCRISNIKNFRCYFKHKIEVLKLQTFDYKPHFKTPCFNCSSNFHSSSFEDGYFNLQKIFQVEKECNSCQRKLTTQRSFYHNCNICNTSFANCQLLFHHRRRAHHLKKPRQCAACHLSLSYKGFYHHIYKHKPPHVCPYCNKRCGTNFYLNWHMLSHTGEKQFSCKYCPKQYTTKQNLDIHLFEHTGAKRFKCDLCYKSYAKKYLLKHHKYIHMDQFFPCPLCPKQYKSVKTLNIHLFEHNGSKPFKCDLCEKTFAKQHMLNRHNRSHMKKHIHIENAFQCEYCPKQYKTKHSFDAHLFEHIGGKQFKCDLCDKFFAKQYLLNQHKSIHMGILFQCIYCSKGFKTKKGLELHLFEHTGGKEFECELCGKMFAKQFKLNQHKITHMEQTFQCKFCPRQYKSIKTLNLHLFKHAGNK